MSDARENVVERLAKWCAENRVRMCVLFGSQATGRTHPDSDVDVALWPDAATTSSQKLQWIVALEQLLNHDVSLVLVSVELDPVLGFEIVKNGRLIYEREPELWFRERLRLWHAYNDSLPFRRHAYQRLKQLAQEQTYGA